MCGGGARSSKVKQGQARSSKVKQGQARSSKVKQGQGKGVGFGVRSLKCDGKLALSGRANLAKRHGKFTPNGTANLSQI
ncbi:TPA: hypothetical protein R1X38_001649 [Campylobacter upsaliensis]|nr:hypothetical protein [Campylobacter upsaliensis]